MTEKQGKCSNSDADSVPFNERTNQLSHSLLDHWYTGTYFGQLALFAFNASFRMVLSKTTKGDNRMRVTFRDYLIIKLVLGYRWKQNLRFEYNKIVQMSYIFSSDICYFLPLNSSGEKNNKRRFRAFFKETMKGFIARKTRVSSYKVG